MAIVLAPEPPLPEWLAELDALVQRSPAFFVGRPVILDVAALTAQKPDLTALIAEFDKRAIRIMAVEGAEPSLLGLGLPPPLSGGRPVGPVEVPEAAPENATPRQADALVLDAPVRSGQSVFHPKGDVVVVGSVASGAEIVAGGSIHVYGALRGRAIAGSGGNPGARIFCRKFEPELLAIDGLYKTADEMEGDLRGQPVQAWLDRDTIVMTALN